MHPEQNVIYMMDALLKISPTVEISSIIKTEAVGFNSNSYFLNLVVRIFSSYSAAELKNKLVHVETQLGRDRTDPNRKLKDRPADLDILFSMTQDQLYIDKTLIPDEKYVRPSVIELLHYLDLNSDESPLIEEERISLLYQNQLIGKTPFTLQQKE